RKKCFSYVQTVNAATRIFRRNLPKHESVRLSARSVLPAPRKYLVASAPPAVVSLYNVLVARQASWQSIRLRQSVAISHPVAPMQPNWRLELAWPVIGITLGRHGTSHCRQIRQADCHEPS